MRCLFIGMLWAFFAGLNPANAQQDWQLLGHLPYEEELSDVWGYEAGDGTEYALVGAFNGFSIVELSETSEPEEIFFFEGAESIWRDIKVWNEHAYVVNESGGGLLITDLGNLPFTADTLSIRSVDTFAFETAHNIFIDEQGILYLFGSNIAIGGAVMLDLSINPKEPLYLGLYDERYVHDGFARGDTLWTAEIANGLFSVVDITDKANPQLLATENSPLGFAHNCWLSDDGSTLFVTDEYPEGPVTSYDVNDLGDIKELDQYQSDPGTGVIPHNTFYLNGYLVTSYYRDGVIITDAHRPDNLVEVSRFDTSPLPPAGQFNGCWGVYPYFSSGKVIATDIEEGLFVLQPVYRRASYLEGTITESLSGTPRFYAKVEILDTGMEEITDLLGRYKTGVSDSGLYNIRVSASGCVTEIIPGVELKPGEVTLLDVSLNCTTTAVIDTLAGEDLLLRALPNPFTHQSRLLIQNPFAPDANATLWIVNTRGELIMERVCGAASEEIVWGEGLPPGMYLVLLQSGQKQRSLKLLKTAHH